MGINKLKTDAGILGFFWKFIWTPIVVILAVLPLLFINVLQLPSLFIAPFSMNLHRRYQRVVCYLVWGWWILGVKLISGVNFAITGDDIPNSENAIVITNHQSMADIIFLLCLSYEKKAVHFTKWMIKDPIKWFPGIGWGLLFLENIFLKRNWADDSQKIEKTFHNVVHSKLPIWMLFFPEGTRRNPNKQLANTEFGKKQKLPPLKHVLYPRPKGFLATVEGLKSHVKAVYSVTIGYPGGAPNLLSAIKGDLPLIHLHIKRTAINALPQSKKELKQWLNQDILRKEALLEQFALHGEFPS